MLKMFTVALALLLSAPAFAQTPEGPGGPLQRCAGDGSTVELASGAVARSFTISPAQISSWGLLGVYIQFVYNTVTRVDMVCTTTLDGVVYEIQACDETTVGTCASSDGANFQSETLAANKNWVWRLNIEGFNAVTCTLSVGAGAQGTDTVVVTSRLCTKGS